MFGQVSAVAAEREDLVPPAQPVRRGEGVRALLTQNYRESYGMFAVSGILFNHESPRRGAEFVPRKVSLGVAKIKLGIQAPAAPGQPAFQPGLGIRRRLRRAMQLMLSQDEPADYVIGTGETHTGQELVECAFRAAGLDWRDHVVTDAPSSGRPRWTSCGPTRPGPASELGWEPKIGFEELVAMMVDADLELLASTNGDFGDVFGPDTW